MKFIVSKFRNALWVLVMVITMALGAWVNAALVVVRVDNANGSASPTNHGEGWGTDAYK